MYPQAAIISVLLASLAGAGSATTGSGRLLLVEDGQSRYRIVVGEKATPGEQEAAAELQSYLKQTARVELPIVSDRERPSRYEIIVGKNRRLAALKTPIPWKKLGNEGFLIRTVGDRMVIAGGLEKGTLYGVYTFLEEHLGCRWYSSKVSVIPGLKRVEIGPTDSIQIPAFAFRSIFYRDMMDQALCARLKVNGNTSIGKTGGWGLWCHTFAALAPPEKYFEEHPEYFALVDGKRIENGQLCLTNPHVLTIVIDDLKRRIRENPQDLYWSVSQNDGGGNCQCENCRAIDTREGTAMGSLLEFVNKVAARFPDRIIATLAYTYSRKPPARLRPARNVAIQLCDIECPRKNAAAPIASDPDHARFREDVLAWGKICDKLILWDYVVQFENLVSPYPNFRMLQPNMRFFRDNRSQGVFSQGNREFGGEFAELRGYLLAKLMWNPDCDLDALMDDFLRGYYGPAARPIRRYIDLLHDSLEQSGLPLSMDARPNSHRNGYLSEAMMLRYNALFDEAERRAASDPDVLLRVRTARMPLMYAQLELGYGDVDARRATAHQLFDLADRTGLQMFTEVDLPYQRGSVKRYKAYIMESLEREKEGVP